MLDLVKYLDVKNMKCLVLNRFRPNPEQKEKINLIFIFTLLCGAQKVLLKC